MSRRKRKERLIRGVLEGGTCRGKYLGVIEGDWGVFGALVLVG